MGRSSTGRGTRMAKADGEVSSNCQQCECCEGDECDVKAGRLLAQDILQEGGNFPLDTSPPLLPSWYNHQLIQQGQNYFHQNYFAIFVAKLSGLIAILAVPSILEVLIKTNKSSDSVSAYKRYLGTINNMIYWYQSDLRNPNSKGRQSINSVRRQHFSASKSFGPITQRDMALTQFGFIGLAISSSEQLGLCGNQEGIIHFWKTIGHLMGIKDRFNLCRGSVKCTYYACKELSLKYFGPLLDKPPEQFENMSTALVTGVWPIMPLIFYPAALEYTRRLCDLPPKPVSFFYQLILNVQILTLRLLNIRLFAFLLRPYLNSQMWLAIFLQNTLPLLAYLTFSSKISNTTNEQIPN